MQMFILFENPTAEGRCIVINLCYIIKNRLYFNGLKKACPFTVHLPHKQLSVSDNNQYKNSLVTFLTITSLDDIPVLLLIESVSW